MLGLDNVIARTSSGNAARQIVIGDVASENTWVQWLYEWDAAPGEHEISVRAIAADGDVQTGDIASPAPDGATGWHTRRVRVDA